MYRAHEIASLILLLTLTGACGGARTTAEEPPPAEAAAEPAPEPEPVEAVETQGQIHRGELLPILDAGLGRFLQGVETEPDTDDGAFIGFRIVSLYPDDDRFQGLDLHPGDTVIRVNGQPIERPEQALTVWNSLRVASELMIEYLRDGERRELRFEIVD